MAKKYFALGNILKKMLFEKDMKPADLAREVNIPSPTIHRLVTGKSTRPYKSSLKPIADYFAITIEQLVGEQPLPHELVENQSKNELGNSFTEKSIKTIPLVPWEHLMPIHLIDKNNFETVPFVGNISENAYATIIQDSSMEPIFARGSLLIFDPHKLPKDRSYVLVKLHETNLPVFRQLLIDLNHMYLKPLNPDLNNFKMRLVEENDQIIATLIEARQIY